MGVRGPSRGSLAYWHRSRSKRMVPRVRSWNFAVKGLSGFAGYKVGMTHVVMVDDSNSPTKGQEVIKSVTIMEVPPMFVYSIVAYAKTKVGLKCVAEATAANAPKEFASVHTLAKNPKVTLKHLQEMSGKLSEIRVIAFTQPRKTALKNSSDIVEIAIGGNASEALEFAGAHLGKEVSAKDVFQEGEVIDTIAVTTGKGWQGVVKRYGVALNPHKATAHRRRGGSIGPERQAKVMYTIPRAGQMGFHRRTDRNKRIVKIYDETKPFPHYGIPKSSCLMIEGSIPGPAKRVIRLRKTLFDVRVKKPELKALTA